MEDKFIDIDQLIKSKNPKLYRWMPNFVLRYLKKKIHQDDSNQVLADNKDANGYEFSKAVLKELNIKVNIQGLENVPKEGGVIFAVNHPLGGIDALAIIDEVYPLRNDLKFVVNDLLLQLPNLKDLFIGVNKHGSNSKASLQVLNEIFASDQAIFVFPAGLVSRKKKGKIEDLEWKKTFITRAKKFKKNIVPIHIEGELSNFFYRLSNFRTTLGIKANIEMFYLVDELFNQKNKTLNITIHPEVDYKTFTNDKTDLEWAQSVKEIVYSLPQK